MNWNYIAGFFDGEGTIGLYNNRGCTHGGTGRLHSRIGQIRPAVLHEIRAFLEHDGILSKVRPHKHSKLSKNVMWYLCIQHGSVENFLRRLSGRLIVKKTMAQDVLRFRKLYPSLSKAQSGKIRGEYRWVKSNNLPPVGVTDL